jgi:hypothetical protein
VGFIKLVTDLDKLVTALPTVPVMPVFAELPLKLNILFELFLEELPENTLGIFISGSIDDVLFTGEFELGKRPIARSPAKMTANSIINPAYSFSISLTIDVRYSYGNIV